MTGSEEEDASVAQFACVQKTAFAGQDAARNARVCAWLPQSWMWKDGALEMVEEEVRWRALHTADGVCTGVLRGAVGSVGKMGRNGGWSGGFSNCPEINGRVLEKWGGLESRMESGFGRCFHFSTVNYGYYWFLLP